MEIQIKSFEELTNAELYGILRLRGEVFVVEQQCAYQDVDNLDQRAIHLMLIYGSELLGYARIFKPGELSESAASGRVVVSPKHRSKAHGKKLMEASMAWIRDGFQNAGIEISAQAHLISFYSSLGFNEAGEKYLEDGIPHVRMVCVS